MTQTASHPAISVEAYLAGEDGSEVRHEYMGGRLYAMTGSSDRHGLIVVNILAYLRPLVRGTGCQVFAYGMKVRLCVSGDDVFYYPDLLLACDPSDRETDFSTRPCLIVEVLSDSTERIDRREKFLAYQTIPSLQEYLLVSQNGRRLQLHRRSRDWVAEVGTEGAIRLDCELTLDVVYEDVPQV